MFANMCCYSGNLPRAQPVALPRLEYNVNTSPLQLGVGSSPCLACLLRRCFTAERHIRVRARHLQTAVPVPLSNWVACRRPVFMSPWRRRGDGSAAPAGNRGSRSSIARLTGRDVTAASARRQQTCSRVLYVCTLTFTRCLSRVDGSRREGTREGRLGVRHL